MARGGWCWMYVFAWVIIPLALILAVLLEEPVVTKLDPHNPPVASSEAEQPAEDFGVATESMGSGKMFDNIASVYDATNFWMSLGLDTYWRNKLIKDCMRLESQDRILDLATGTADVSILAASELQELDSDLPTQSVLGVDPSSEMLRIGVGKVSKFGGAVRLVKGDAQNLNTVRNITIEGDLADPTDGVATGSIDKISMAFGIRNVPDRSLALREMRRVLRKQDRSRVCILEFAIPSGETFLSGIARAFITHVIPFIGTVATAGSGSVEYKYLERSILKFPQPMDFAASMAKEGLGVDSITTFAYGAVHLYSASPIGS